MFNAAMTGSSYHHDTHSLALVILTVESQCRSVTRQMYCRMLPSSCRCLLFRQISTHLPRHWLGSAAPILINEYSLGSQKGAEWADDINLNLL
jgi:hypothetical protein